MGWAIPASPKVRKSQDLLAGFGTLREGPRGDWVAADGQTYTTTESGYCDRTTHTLWVNIGDSLREAVIIHEICHAVSGDMRHGTRFCARMRKAVVRARALGSLAIAAELEKEAEAYPVLPRVTAQSVYGYVQDILTDVPNCTFENVLLAVADEFAATGPEILAGYPRLRAVYERLWRRELRDTRPYLQAARRRGVPPAYLVQYEERLRLLEAMPQ